MKTTLLPDALRRLLRLALIAWFVALAGCGPGTGGTGTGPESTFAVGPSSAPSTGGPGISSLRADCGRDCPGAVLQLDAMVVELSAPCLRFVHVGEWSADGTHVSLKGTLQITVASETRSGAATLHMQFTTAVAESPVVTVTVIDDVGRTALGPLVLKRTAGGAASLPTACVN